MGGMAGGEPGVIEMRGIPFRATVGEIQTFFAGRQIAPGGVQLEYGADSRPAGAALVKFVSEAEAQEAMKKNKEMMGTRYVDLFASTMMDWEWKTRKSGMMGYGAGMPNWSTPRIY